MAEVDSRLVGAPGGAYARPSSLDLASEVLSRDSNVEGPKKAALVREAEAAARELAAVANPSEAERATLERLEALLAQLTSAPAKTWNATGAAKTKAVSAAPAPAKLDAAAAAPVSKVAAPLPAALPEAVALDPTTGTAKLTAPMTLKALAANAFGVAESEVGETHLALLAQTNEALAKLGPDAKVPAGTTVSLLASPRVADLQRKAVLKGLEAVDQVLSEARAAQPGSGKELTADQLLKLSQERAQLVAQGQALQAQLPNLRAYDAIGKSEASRNRALELLKSGDLTKAAPLMAAARKELDGALQVKDLPAGAQAVLLKRRGELSALEATVATQAPELAAYREKNSGKTITDLAQLPPAVQAAAKKSLSAVNDGFNKAKADLQASAAQYRAQAKGAEPEEQKRLTGLATQLETDAAGLEARRQSALGSVYAAVGDSANQLESVRKELDAVAGPGTGALLKGSEEHRVKDDGKAASAVDWFGTTTLKSMSRTELETFKAKLAKLTPEQQTKALAVVAKYGEAGSATGDASALNTSRQVLEAKAAQDPKGPWASQAAMTKGNYLMRLGNPKEATKAFQEAGAKAATITDPAMKRAAEAGALMGEASALSARTQEGNAPEKMAAAKALREVRLKAEAKQPPLFDQSTLAQLTFSEVNGHLAANESAAAEAALAHLKKTYGGQGADGKPAVPWLNDGLKKFEAENREGGAAAFSQVMMSEMAGRQSVGEKLAFLATTTAAGAGAGFLVGGVGAIPGALIGLGAGGIGLIGGNAIEGFDHAVQAGRTGLARQSWVETLTDGIGIVTDVVGMAAPLKGMAFVGEAGMRAMTSGAAAALDTEAAAVLASRALSVERAMGSEAFAKLSKPMQEEAARKMLLKDFSAASLRVGGAAVPVAGLSVAAAGVAKGLVEIENNPGLSPDQKAAARQQLMSTMGRSLVQSLPQMALQMALHHSAMSGLPGDVRKAVAAASNAKTAAVVLEEKDFNAKLKAAAEDEIRVKGLTGQAAADVRAHYDGIIKNGDGHIDLGTGNVYINAKSGAKAGEILRHEVAHRDFHQLPLGERQKLVATLEELKKPEHAAEYQALMKQVMDANPHGGGFTPLQIIDEYQAMTRSASGATKGLSGASPMLDRALEGAGLKGVKDLPTEKLLKDGKLDLGRFRSQSGERLGMGASGIEAPNAAALKALAPSYAPLKSVLSVVDHVPGLRAQVDAIKPARMEELISANNLAWGTVLNSGNPPAALTALFGALKADSPDALKALLAKRPADITASAPALAPKPPVGNAGSVSGAATSSVKPAGASVAPAVAAAPTGVTEAIDALGSSSASVALKGALKKATPEQAQQFGAFAQALGDQALSSNITLNKAQLAEAFAKGDDATRAAMIATLKDASAARNAIKGMASGTGAPLMNQAVELALKSPANSATMKALGAVADGLQTAAKLDPVAKESIAKAAKAAVEKGDAEALKNLGANLERLKDPAAAQRLSDAAKLGNLNTRIGELLAQPAPERVAMLRVMANRAGGATDELNVEALAKKAFSNNPKMAEFMANEASPELMHSLLNAKAGGKSFTEKVLAELPMWNADSVTVLRAANKYQGSALETFCTHYADAASARDVKQRVGVAEYRTAVDLTRDGPAPALKFGDRNTDWKLGQAVDDRLSIGEQFKANQSDVYYSGNRLTGKLKELQQALRTTNDPAKYKALLDDIYKEIISVNTEVATYRQGVNPELALQLQRLEAQVRDLRKLTPAQQMAAIKANK